METSQVASDTAERRSQQRIGVQAPIKLTLQGTDESISAVNREISWGGALFTVPQPLPTGLESLLINLPWARGQQITIQATILRTTRLPNGQYLVATRFSSLTPESQVRLEKLLTMLRGKGDTGNGKTATDLFQELEVIVGDVEEFRHISEQIADGRYILHKFNAYEKNQSILLSVEGPDDLQAIRLRARVVDVSKAESQEFGWSDLHVVTLEFEHPRESVTRLVDALLNSLPKGDGASPAAGSAGTDKAPRAVVSDSRCAIEIDFPGVALDLTSAWGNAEAFATLFRKLIFGHADHAVSCWPPAVWEELVFLQSVHDQAYRLAGD